MTHSNLYGGKGVGELRKVIRRANLQEGTRHCTLLLTQEYSLIEWNKHADKFAVFVT